jgi:hypothetical protein
VEAVRSLHGRVRYRSESGHSVQASSRKVE